MQSINRRAPAPDPIFAALENVKGADARSLEAYCLFDEAEGEGLDRNVIALLRQQNETAKDQYNEAVNQLATVAPTTAAGCAALVRYVVGMIQHNDPEDRDLAMLANAAGTLERRAAIV